MTKISFITSCYNGAPFLDGLCKNILQQSHKDWEHLIVDSNSTDDSVLIAEYWTKQDPRFKLIKQKTRVPYGVSWLDGFRAAQGDILSNSNCDDRSEPYRTFQVISAHERLKNQNMILRQEKLYFYYGGYSTVKNGVKIAWGTPPAYSEDDWSQFFRAGVHIHLDAKIRNIIDWDFLYSWANKLKSAFDYFFCLNMISLGIKGVAIPSCFSIYNQRDDSVEQSNKELNTFESIESIRTFYPNGKVMYDLENKTKYDSPEFYKRYYEWRETLKI